MEHPRTEFLSPDTLAPPFGFSHVASVGPGRMVWVSGQLPLAADGTLAPAGDMAAQARQCFANVGRALAAAGAGWADVVKLTYYVTTCPASRRSARCAMSSSTRRGRRRARSCASRGSCCRRDDRARGGGLPAGLSAQWV